MPDEQAVDIHLQGQLGLALVGVVQQQRRVVEGREVEAADIYIHAGLFARNDQAFVQGYRPH